MFSTGVENSLNPGAGNLEPGEGVTLACRFPVPGLRIPTIIVRFDRPASARVLQPRHATARSRRSGFAAKAEEKNGQIQEGQANVSTEYQPPRQASRLPGPHGDQGRPAGVEAPPRQGPQAPDRFRREVKVLGPGSWAWTERKLQVPSPKPQSQRSCRRARSEAGRLRTHLQDRFQALRTPHDHVHEGTRGGTGPSGYSSHSKNGRRRREKSRQASRSRAVSSQQTRRRGRRRRRAAPRDAGRGLRSHRGGIPIAARATLRLVRVLLRRTRTRSG